MPVEHEVRVVAYAFVVIRLAVGKDEDGVAEGWIGHDGFEAGLAVLSALDLVVGTAARVLLLDWIDELVVVEDARTRKEWLEGASDGELADAWEAVDVDHGRRHDSAMVWMR